MHVFLGRTQEINVRTVHEQSFSRSEIGVNLTPHESYMDNIRKIQFLNTKWEKYLTGDVKGCLEGSKLLCKVSQITVFLRNENYHITETVIDRTKMYLALFGLRIMLELVNSVH